MMIIRHAIVEEYDKKKPNMSLFLFETKLYSIRTGGSSPCLDNAEVGNFHYIWNHIY